MVKIGRFFKHIFTSSASVRKIFSESDLNLIENCITEAERKHNGEIRFCVEASLEAHELYAGITPHQRARQVFSELGIWDTENNNGVLLYLLLADRDIEIIADRAIAARVSAEEWEKVCREIESHFRSGKFLDGVKLGIQRISEHLQTHFPSDGRRGSELSNRPVII